MYLLCIDTCKCVESGSVREGRRIPSGPHRGQRLGWGLVAGPRDRDLSRNRVTCCTELRRRLGGWVVG